jgi:glycosyltransferase involved in cell wall biosynthesis
MLDGRTLAAPYRGFSTYLRNLLPRLGADPRLKVSMLTPDGVETPAGVRAIPLRRRAPGRFASLEHDLRLPFDLRRQSPDVFHSPADDPPRRHRGPWVHTLHSTLAFETAEPALRTERDRWRRYGPRLLRATTVVTVSRFCADEAVRLLGLPPERVVVVHHGVDDAFREASPPVPAGPPYVLSVGEYGPWKGYVEAFGVAGALADAGYPHSLRVAGRMAPWVEPTVRQLVDAAPRPDRVDLVGYVGPDALPSLYAGAACLIMTSRFESFGLPLVEAMAAGTPVVAFDNTAIAEVVGNGAMLVPDGDVTAMTAAIRLLLDNTAAREEQVDAGRKRAEAFDWDDSARAHAEVYRAAVA